MHHSTIPQLIIQLISALNRKNVKIKKIFNYLIGK